MISKKIEEFLLKVQKPGRYIGQELNIVVKDLEDIKIRFAFCFPDVYEVGMSHLGMKILYSLLNKEDDIWCERVFAPWVDMQTQMEKNDIKLYGLESGEPITDFDFIGFTLQYELSFTNILNMLNLAGIPLYSSGRCGLKQIVIAGGPCSYNPEPLADFIDIFVMGEGEEVLLELMDAYRKSKNLDETKNDFLLRASKIEGIYVPKFYNVSYNEDGTIRSFMPNIEGVPTKIKKRVIKDLNKCYYPNEFVVPLIDVVHNRAVSEIFRGCIRGCRFCQAGFIYRPTREKDVETINKQSYDLCQSTGYDEISLSSLSSSDYTKINELLCKLSEWANNDHVSISFPSLRVDGFSKEMISKLKSVRKSGLTFAPEAGSQRLRDVINKNVTEQELINTCKMAFEDGWDSVKLYFMIGLPTEEYSDIEGIINLANKIMGTYKQCPSRVRRLRISVSVSSFVPKAFTPFQWESQDTIDKIKEKQNFLKSINKNRNILLNWHDPYTSFLEAVFARGDRRLCKVLYKAFEMGIKFDSWTECFNFDKWLEVFNQCKIDPHFYANRKRNINEILPWDHIDIGVSKEYFIGELKKSLYGITSPNCRERCLHCGASCFGGGVCFEKSKSKI